MGIASPDLELQYSVFCSNKKVGETPILRHPLMVNKELRKINKFNVRTTWEAMENNIKKGNGEVRMIGYRKRLSKNKFEKKLSWLTYRYIYDNCIFFAKGIEFFNLCPLVHSHNSGDFRFLGIYSKNRKEWIIAFLGSHANNRTIVAIYDTLGEQAVEYIFEQTKLETILIEASNLPKILKLIKEKRGKKLKNLIVMDSEDEPITIKELQSFGINIYTFDEIIETGKAKGKNIVLTPAKPESICSICYTSGTTGIPKGAMITHEALESTIDCMDHTGFEYLKEDVYLSYLPYSHMMETLIFTLIMTHGRTLAIYSGNPRNLLEDAKICKPSIMTAVPRILQRIYDEIAKGILKETKIIQNIFKMAINKKIKDYQETGILTNPFLDSLIFRKIKNNLGGKLRFMLVGSAPMEPSLLNFLQCVLSCKIVEGYGQTEGCAGVLITSQYDKICQHLGGPGWNCEIKLVDVDELDYHSTDVDPETGENIPRGELCIRGPLLFKGYFDDEENTKLFIDKDGWLHTGDIAQILIGHGNAIRIIDRIKNIFKLQQGEYVAAEKIENILIDSKYIDQIFVHGESLHNYLIAIIVPNKTKVVDFLSSKRIKCDEKSCQKFYEDETLKNEIIKDIEIIGRKADLKGFELVKKIFLFSGTFSHENDLVTPTLKLKRHIAKKLFANEIRKLYNK